MTATCINEPARNEVLAALTTELTRLRACTKNDQILAWPYGLGVAFHPLRAIALHKADTATTADEGKNVRNGNNEPAHLVNRQDAIATEIARIEANIASIRVAK